jgi:trehalose 6-phosphate phosphatase
LLVGAGLVIVLTVPAPCIFRLQGDGTGPRKHAMIPSAPELAYPRHVSEEIDLLARALGSAAEVFLFLDYGGTLVPGSRGASPQPTPELRAKLEQLAREDAFSVFVVSRRRVAELDEILGIPEIGFVGQGGFEIRGADGALFFPVDPAVTGSLIRELERSAAQHLACFPGVEVENLGCTLSVRLPCDEDRVAREATQRFVALVREVDSRRQLEVLYDQSTVDVRLAGWHKGHAVRHILAEADRDDTLAIYIGDDVTDEDAFEAVGEWSGADDEDGPWDVPPIDDDEDDWSPGALTVLVAERPRPSSASLFVRSPKEVYEFLSSLAAVASSIL